MTLKGAVRWGLRPKRIAVMVAKLLLAGTTDLAAQTTRQEVNSSVPQVSIHLDAQGPYREVLYSPRVSECSSVPRNTALTRQIDSTR
jgi:hypothetical protein